MRIFIALSMLLCISTVNASVLLNASLNQLKNDNKLSFIGRAYDQISGDLLYSEEHYFLNTTFHTVIYKEPTGKIFARKEVFYLSNAFAPDIYQVNHRNGESINIHMKDNQYLIRYQENLDKPMKTRSIRDNTGLVIDAGFNKYIQTNWQLLTANQSPSIKYLLPTRQTTIELVIERTSCKESNQTCFLIEPSNWFFRMLSKPLVLTYDSDSRKLMTFQGKSNISDSEGNYQEVLIHYDFSPEAAL